MPELIASCWTSAGDVLPTSSPSTSPVDILDRITTVAETGFAGMGIAQDDLAHIRDTIGFQAVRRALDTSGLKYVEIELLEKWWIPEGADDNTYATRRLLFDAADALSPTHIKIGSMNGPAPESLDNLVEPLATLTAAAAQHGTRIAIEPMPFSMISTVPAGIDLARRTNDPSCGVIVDAWHVFRAGTPIDELTGVLSPDLVFGVELNDADETVVGTLFEDTMHNRRLCGDGTFDLVALVAALRSAGYRGTWGVEILSDEFRATELETALAAAAESALRFL